MVLTLEGHHCKILMPPSTPMSHPFKCQVFRRAQILWPLGTLGLGKMQHLPRTLQSSSANSIDPCSSAQLPAVREPLPGTFPEHSRCSINICWQSEWAMMRGATEEAEGVFFTEDSMQLRELFTDFCSEPSSGELKGTVQHEERCLVGMDNSLLSTRDFAGNWHLQGPA